MAQNQKSYDNEFKAQAVKLAQEIGGHKAAQELGIPKGTMYTWIKAFKEGRLSANEAVHTPKNVYCKIKLPKVAKQKWTKLQVHFGQSCNLLHKGS